MITLDVKQNSAEWYLLRLGIPTASGAGNIITASKGEKSKSWDGYISELIAERHAKQIVEEKVKRANVINPDADVVVEHIQRILNRKQTEGMAYGHEMEPEAGEAYSFLTGNEVTEVGFMMNDERTAGASLDVHIKYCLSRNIEIDKRPQLQWQLWISGLEEIDICAYYPATTVIIIPVSRDEEYIGKIAEYHAEFYKLLEERWQEWQNMQTKR